MIPLTPIGDMATASMSADEGPTIPESVEYQFVASSWTEGSDWQSEGGGATLSEVGSPTKQAGDLNGETTIYFDGSSDGFTSSISMSQPDSVVVVGRHISGTGGESRFFDCAGGGRQILTAVESGSFGVYAGSWMTDGATDTDWHILNPLYDGSNSDLRIDGVEEVSGNVGGDGLDSPGFGLNSGASNGGKHEMEIAEIWFMSSPSTADRDEADAYLSDKYGIAI